MVHAVVLLELRVGEWGGEVGRGGEGEVAAGVV